MRRITFFSQIAFFVFFITPTFASDFRSFKQIEINPNELNFALPEFQARFFTSQIAFDEFFQENTRNLNVSAPALPIDWKGQVLLSIHWASEDRIIRMPSFLHSEVKEILEENEAGETKTTRSLILTFLLNTPCFGIITDVSPVLLAAFDFSDLNFSDIQIKTEHSQSINCFADEEERASKLVAPSPSQK